MNKKPKVTLTSDGTGSGTRVLVGDVDITHLIRGYMVTHDSPIGLASLALELVPGKLAEFECAFGPDQIHVVVKGAQDGEYIAVSELTDKSVVVVTSKDKLSQEQCARIQQSLRPAIPQHIPILVLDGGITLAAYVKADPDGLVGGPAVGGGR